MGVGTSPPLVIFDQGDASAFSPGPTVEPEPLYSIDDDDLELIADMVDSEPEAVWPVDDMVISQAEPEAIIDMQTDKSDCVDGFGKVYPIPAEIPDTKLEEFIHQMNSKSSVGSMYTVTEDLAARTIRIKCHSKKLMPGPALNNYGILQLTTFTVPFPEKRATKLKDVWLEVESTLYDYSISCDLNLADRCMRVSTTPSLKDPCIIEKARHLLELLSTSLVPPYMALEIFQNVRQHETIDIGFQQGGICLNLGINKDDYRTRREILFCSLKALSIVTCCHLFLDESTLTAVTAAESSVDKISQLKTAVHDCLVMNVCPLISIRRSGNEIMPQPIDDPRAKHTECCKSGCLWNKDGMLQACSLYTSLHENQVSNLKQSWQVFEPYLRQHGVKCTLDEKVMVLYTFRGTKDPDIIDKAWQFLELLSTTHVPASLAVELFGGIETCLIKIGHQEGGLSTLFGIKKEDYNERWKCLRHSLQILAETLECNIFLNNKVVAAVGEAPVTIIKLLVENCIRHNVCPGTLIRDFNCFSKGMISIEDPHVQHREIDSSAMTVMPELTSFCTFIEVEQATLVQKDWKSVEACLSKHGYSCKLITQAEFCYCFMIVSKTKNIGDLDITDKIWDFLKLVSIELQPSKAIGILNGSMHCQFIPAGYECGGPLCSKFGVTEEQYAEVVWPRIQNSFEKLSSRLRCEFIVMPDFIAVFGSTQVKVFCGFVYNVCFRLKHRPALRFRGGWKSR